MHNESKKGFTLIELLIVVVIIGILAAIAIPKFASTREKAYISTMKSDLRNLATEQEIYYSDNLSYTDDLTATGLAFNASGPEITLTVNNADADSWDADATHSAAPGWTCSIAVDPVTNGQVTCVEA